MLLGELRDRRVPRIKITAFLLASLTLVISQTEEVNHGERLIQWLRDKGGVVNENIEIRRVNPNDPVSRFGMFTNGDLQKKTRISIGYADLHRKSGML